MGEMRHVYTVPCALCSFPPVARARPVVFLSSRMQSKPGINSDIINICACSERLRGKSIASRFTVCTDVSRRFRAIASSLTIQMPQCRCVCIAWRSRNKFVGLLVLHTKLTRSTLCAICMQANDLLGVNMFGRRTSSSQDAFLVQTSAIHGPSSSIWAIDLSTQQSPEPLKMGAADSGGPKPPCNTAHLSLLKLLLASR
jgi:hypothetical protein